MGDKKVNTLNVLKTEKCELILSKKHVNLNLVEKKCEFK